MVTKTAAYGQCQAVLVRKDFDRICFASKPKVIWQRGQTTQASRHCATHRGNPHFPRHNLANCIIIIIIFWPHISWGRGTACPTDTSRGSLVLPLTQVWGSHDLVAASAVAALCATCWGAIATSFQRKRLNAPGKQRNECVKDGCFTMHSALIPCCLIQGLLLELGGKRSLYNVVENVNHPYGQFYT